MPDPVTERPSPAFIDAVRSIIAPEIAERDRLRDRVAELEGLLREARRLLAEHARHGYGCRGRCSCDCGLNADFARIDATLAEPQEGE